MEYIIYAVAVAVIIWVNIGHDEFISKSIAKRVRIERDSEDETPTIHEWIRTGDELTL